MSLYGSSRLDNRSPWAPSKTTEERRRERARRLGYRHRSPSEIAADAAAALQLAPRRVTFTLRDGLGGVYVDRLMTGPDLALIERAPWTSGPFADAAEARTFMAGAILRFAEINPEFVVIGAPASVEAA